MRTNLLKTRWAAIGAAVAVTLGAGGLGISFATGPAGAVAFVPITPCRVLDTRPAPDNVGNRATPIGAEETHTVDAHGANGNCTGIPTGATGLSLNVTALGATSGTFLTLWATGATQPTASNLNPQPGQPPTPNAVTTGISSGGQFNIFNKVGSVNVIVDIVGYYTDHTHSAADIVDEPGVAFTNTTAGAVNLVTTAEIVSTVAIRPPANGYVTVQASGSWFSSIATTQLACQITDGTSVIDFAKVRLIDTDDSATALANAFSLQQTFEVPAYTGLLFSGRPFNLVCSATDSGANLRDIAMTATYFPSSYGPITIVVFPNEALPAGTPDGTPGGVVGG